MRISTGLIYQQGVASMQRQQAELAKTQQQMSLGTRILTPADDPVAAARVLLLEQASANNEQYKSNRSAARSALGLEENTLASVGNLLQDIRTTVVYAGNPTLTNSDRAALVNELTNRFDELMGLANATNGAGQYLFSGYEGSTRPFSGPLGAVQYGGDQGQRLIQAGASRQLAVSDSGYDVFQRVARGNGSYLATAAAGNAGTGLLGAASGTYTGDTYEIRFTGATTYDVVNTTTGTSFSTGNTYTAGGLVDVDGVNVEIKGAPASGDVFTVAPAGTQSVFKTVSDLISAVGAAVSSPAGSVALSNALGAGLQNIDQALDKVLSVRADVGARLQELDSLDALGDGVALEYAKATSELKDLDYTKAISDLTRQQVMLEAAQRSFTRITGMSLFDFLG